MSRYTSRLIDVCLNGFAIGALFVAAILWLNPYGLGYALETASLGKTATFALWVALGSTLSAARLLRDLFDAVDSVN